MCEGFLKLIKSDEMMYLVTRKPNAFKLLTIIAHRARRESGHPDGLLPGQCYIGDLKEMGMSEQTYRTAKAILEKRRHVKIIETCRTRKKSTTGSTTVATLVCIISTNVYDVNINVVNDQTNERATTDQRPTNDKQEGTNKSKKEKENPITPLFPKIAFRENVMLTQIEHDSLLSIHQELFLNSMLDILDAYKGSSGKKYKSDYCTMKKGGWVFQRAKEEIHRSNSKEPVDRRTKNMDGSPISSPAEGRF